MTKPRIRWTGKRLGAGMLVAGLTVASLTPAARAAAPRADNSTLTIGWSTETKTFDPGNNPQNPDIWVMVNIYDQLLRPSADGLRLEPDLATKWDITNGGTVYTFHLRPGVKFTNGAPVTAEDVKFSLDRIRKPGNGWTFLYTAIKNIQAINPGTLKITLLRPWAPFLADVSAFSAAVYPEAYFKKVGAKGMSANPIGSGPYSLEQWKRGQFLRLVKNPNYFNAARYPMQHVEYDLIPNDTSRLLQAESGQLDVDYNLAPNLVPQVQSNPNAHVAINKSTYTLYFIANEQVKPFQDVNVRQAIDHAIDRAAFVKTITKGLGKPAWSFMPVGSVDQDTSIPVPSYDLALAKRYLAKSSVPHGFSMTFDVGSGDIIGNQEAVLLQSELKPLGITVKIVPQDITTLFNNQQAGKYSFSNSGWTNDIPDPDELVSFAMDYSTGNHSINTWYNNPATTKLSHLAEQSNDAAARKQYYYQIQETWAKDMPFYALYYLPYVNAINNHVHGFSENPLGYFNIQGVTKS